MIVWIHIGFQIWKLNTPRDVRASRFITEESPIWYYQCSLSLIPDPGRYTLMLGCSLSSVVELLRAAEVILLLWPMCLSYHPQNQSSLIAWNPKEREFKTVVRKSGQLSFTHECERSGATSRRWITRQEWRPDDRHIVTPIMADISLGVWSHLRQHIYTVQHSLE